MKLIKPYYEIINDDSLLSYFKKNIDVYYDLLTIYLKFPSDQLIYWENLRDEYYAVYKYENEPNTRLQNGDEDEDYNFYVTTCHSVLLKNKWTDDIKYRVHPEPPHEKRISVKFMCDRLMIDKLLQITKDFKMMFNILPFENYDELEYIIPDWTGLTEGEYSQITAYTFCGENEDSYSMLSDDKKNYRIANFLKSIYDVEENYNDLLFHGCSLNDLVYILPSTIKSEIILSGFEWNWKNLCKSVDLPLIKELEKELNNGED